MVGHTGLLQGHEQRLPPCKRVQQRTAEAGQRCARWSRGTQDRLGASRQQRRSQGRIQVAGGQDQHTIPQAGLLAHLRQQPVSGLGLKQQQPQHPNSGWLGSNGWHS